jgi:hypothetical protein
LDATVAPGWTDGGARIVQPPLNRCCGVLTSDDHGGAIVAWAASANIYAQHLTTDRAVATRPSLVNSSADAGRVLLSWFAADASYLAPSVDRRTESSDWTRLGPAAGDGSGLLTYDDRTVSAGRYAYRLVYAEGAGEAFTDEVWVDVPSGAVFALAGFLPNPARGNLPVSFSLPMEGPAQLELFNVTGRRIAAREVGSLGAGAHLVPMHDDGERLPGGVYWLRLTQGQRSMTVKGIVAGS